MAFVIKRDKIKDFIRRFFFGALSVGVTKVSSVEVLGKETQRTFHGLSTALDVAVILEHAIPSIH